MGRVSKTRTPGLSIILGALLMLAAALTRPNRNGSDWASQFEQVGGQPGAALISIGLWAAAGIAFLGGAAGVARIVANGRGRAWMLAAGWLMGLLGVYCFAARVIVLGILHGSSAAQVDPTATMEAFSEGSASIFLAPVFLGGLVLAPVILAIGAWRASRGSWIPAVTWPIGFLLYSMFEWSGIMKEAIGWMVMTASLVWIGIGLIASRGPTGSERDARELSQRKLPGTP